MWAAGLELVIPLIPCSTLQAELQYFARTIMATALNLPGAGLKNVFLVSWALVPFIIRLSPQFFYTEPQNQAKIRA